MIKVNSNQKGNPVLECIKSVSWEYTAIAPDYKVSAAGGVLFLSLKYHRLKPDYIFDRIKSLQQSQFTLRVVLCIVDIDQHQQPIREITKACVLAGFTLFLAWSFEEAGKYLETFKSYEHKPPDIIKERVEADDVSKITDCLTQIKSINKTDVMTLISAFGSLRNILKASPEELAILPGFGDQKVKRFVEAVHSSFLMESASKQQLLNNL